MTETLRSSDILKAPTSFGRVEKKGKKILSNLESQKCLSWKGPLKFI